MKSAAEKLHALTTKWNCSLLSNAEYLFQVAQIVTAVERQEKLRKQEQQQNQTWMNRHGSKT